MRYEERTERGVGTSTRVTRRPGGWGLSNVDLCKKEWCIVLDINENKANEQKDKGDDPTFERTPGDTEIPYRFTDHVSYLSNS